MSDSHALLSDHAYLERKAASNALELLNRWPEPDYPEEWTSSLASIARDESAHLNTVVKVLKARGGRLERLHRSMYAAELRALVRRGENRDELVDRLLVSGLIEARSCERFRLLGEAAAEPDLRDLFDSLAVSEYGHHEVFLRLAGFVRPPEAVARRWDALLDAEADVIRRQAPGPRIHSGVPA